MAKLISGSQSSLLLPLLQPHAKLPGKGHLFLNFGAVSVFPCCKLVSLSTKPRNFQLPLTPLAFSTYPQLHRFITASVSSASNVNIESPNEVLDIKPDTTSGDGDDGNNGDNSGGGGGGGGDRGDSNGGNTGNEGSDDADAKKNKALLMSQKFTLAYAALVGLGGLMGFLKSGSQKSLAFGGLSALLLYYVYSELPKRPVYASAVGLGLSAALLVVMGKRFKKSGKVFPAGVVSLVSLIMTGGYIHGVMKTSH
ncbi:protein FATTY ACID EXPORT 2, chloroplastic-like [Amaranthus tricolor]|uniref:protein FATTY ACID EXPORT 2, chloroplastic-like n=1 Tax=Amaranthus tricolor TaxID=29722 RepID=UPI00258DAB13|nr:protein FATTY ACID EXPORT 2, chloroplastic-like [Amaranthus tricolor]